MQRAWPGLVKALGEGFSQAFTAWARTHPLEVGHELHPLVEARRFADSLRAAGPLPWGAEEEVLACDVRWRITARGGLVARRGLSWRLARGGEPRRWRCVVRLPGGRLLWLPRAGHSARGDR